MLSAKEMLKLSLNSSNEHLERINELCKEAASNGKFYVEVYSEEFDTDTSPSELETWTRVFGRDSYQVLILDGYTITSYQDKNILRLFVGWGFGSKRDLTHLIEQNIIRGGL